MWVPSASRTTGANSRSASSTSRALTHRVGREDVELVFGDRLGSQPSPSNARRRRRSADVPGGRAGEVRADHHDALSAYLSTKPMRVCRPASLSMSKVAWRCGIAHLHRVVHQVAGDDRFLARSRRCARGRGRGVAVARLAPDAGRDLVIGLDEVGEAGRDDRVDAFDEVGVGVTPSWRIVSATPRIRSRRTGSGRWERSACTRRSPVLVGVPADMVEVQVGAHHRVDIARG
jgi:hypothetical protein